MNDKDKDPLLQAPQEANTGKHINFMEVEEGDNNSSTNNADNEEESPTKKAWEELRKDNKRADNNE